MQQFKDEEIRAAHVRLLDAVCSWERATGREITVLVIPHHQDEPIAVSESGKPMRMDGIRDVLFAVGRALDERRGREPWTL